MDSLWFDGGGNRLVNVSLSPEVWIERACDIVGRDFARTLSGNDSFQYTNHSPQLVSECDGRALPTIRVYTGTGILNVWRPRATPGT